MSNDAKSFLMGTAELSLSRFEDDPFPQREKYDLDVLLSVGLDRGRAREAAHKEKVKNSSNQ